MVSKPMTRQLDAAPMKRQPPPWGRPVLTAGLAIGLAAGLASGLVCIAVPAARAYVPSADELFTQLGLQVPAVSRAIFETRALVFDATPRASDRLAEVEGGVEQEPVELPERAFRQRVYWIRDALLAIETLSREGAPLHVYLDEGVAPVSLDLTAQRHFEAIDVIHPFILFMGGRPADWRAGLAAWGIDPWRVGLRPGYKQRNLYRLGDADGPAAYFDPARLALVSLETRILNGAHPVTLTMDFSEAIVLGENLKREEQLYFPRIVNFFINGRLFKQVRVATFRADPPLNAFPLARLRDQARGEARALTLQPGGQP